ncbi:MAG: hypothetical protein R2795_23685 [Saprospiraceae bacterium]
MPPKGEVGKAMSLYEESLAIDEQVGDLRGKGASYMLWQRCICKRRSRKAMSLYEESLAILEQVGDLRGKGATLHAMAAVYLQKGEVGKR